MRRLNVKLLAWLIVCTLVLITGVHFLHGYQVKRNSGNLKTRAETAESNGDLESAWKLYRQYLEYQRDDIDTQVEMCKVMMKLMDKPDFTRAQLDRTYTELQRALREDPRREETLRMLVDFNVKFHNYREAIEHIESLHKTPKEDPELHVKLAECLVKTGEPDKAIRMLQELVGYDPAEKTFDTSKALAAKVPLAYVTLATAVRSELQDNERALATINQMVAANPNSHTAYLERARYLFGIAKARDDADSQQARADLKKALELKSDNVETVLLAATIAATDKDTKQARELLQSALKAHPKDERVYHMMARVAFAENQREEALDCLKEGLKQLPKSIGLMDLQAELQWLAGDQAGLEETVKTLERSEGSGGTLDHAKGRLHVMKGEWADGVRVLEKLRSQIVPRGQGIQIAMQIDLMLARCYERLNQPDRQREAYVRVLQVDPTSGVAQMGVLTADIVRGRLDEANKQLKNLQAALKPEQFWGEPAFWKAYLQLRLAEQMRLPKENRDWKEIDDALSKVRETKKLSDTQMAVVESEIEIRKGNNENAKAILKQALAKAPKDPTLWHMMLAIEGSEKGATADLVNKAEQSLGDSVGLRLVRAEILAREGGEKAAAELPKLEQNTEKFKDPELIRLWNGLAMAYLHVQKRDQAARLWKQIAEKAPNDAGVRMRLFELARDSRDENAMDEAMAEIAKVLGRNSAEWKLCEASRLVLKARETSDKAPLARARTLLKEASDARSGWQPIARLEADIAALEGNIGGRIESLRKVLDAGPADPQAIRHLATLLFVSGQLEEAKKVIDRIPSDQNTDDVRKLRAEIEQGLGNSKDALELAAAAVRTDERNPNSQLWYGQLLAKANQPAAAETAYRRAVEYGPEIPEAWMALIVHLVNAKKTSEARDELRRAEQRLPADRARLLLAQGHDLLGDKDVAETEYLAALEANPDNPSVLRSLIGFYVRQENPEKANKYLDQVMNLKSEPGQEGLTAWARRTRAQLLLKLNDYEYLQQALALLDANARDGKLSEEDRLMKATALWKRPEPSSRQQAIQILEEIQEQRELKSDELFTLAKLYESSGKTGWSRARAHMADLLLRDSDNTELTGGYVQMLLRQGELEEARPWLRKLQESKSANPMVTLELTVRLLVQQNRKDQATLLLRSAFKGKLTKEQIPVALGAAKLAEKLEMNDVADELFRKYVLAQPNGVLELAAFWGRTGDLEKAFGLIQKASETLPILSVSQAGIGVLRARRDDVNDKHFQQVEQWLAKAGRQEPDSKWLQLQQAEFEELKGRLDEVERILRNFLARTDLVPMERAIASNNLAYLLAIQEPPKPGGDELIKESIKVLGPVRDVLDTRAMISMAQRNPKQAIADLELALSDHNEKDSDAVPFTSKYFHLALAHQMNGDLTSAAAAYKQAVDNGFKPSDVPALERSRLQRLETDLARVSNR